MHKKVIRDTVYYYTSVRENGRVKTIYLGRTEEEALKREKQLKSPGGYGGRSFIATFMKSRLLVLFFIIAVIGFGFLFLRGMYVGYVTVSAPEIYVPGEKLTGSVNLTFSSEELYPKDAVVEVSLEEQAIQMDLPKFVEEAGGMVGIAAGSGEYYVAGSGISGQGEGFGISGEKTVYPEIAFSYALSCYSENENKNVEDKFDGVCSAEKPYVKQISENLTDCTISLTGVYLRNETVDESFVQVTLENNRVVVATTYTETEKGLGKGFVSGEERHFSVVMEKFNLSVPEKPGDYVLRIRVLYKETTLEETGKNITVSAPLIEIPEVSEAQKKIECEDKDKDGFDTCKQPVDCDDNNVNVNPKAKEICGNLIDENCDGFDEACDNLASLIESKKITYVAKEVENEIAGKKEARVIIKFRDVKNKLEIGKGIKTEREIKNFVSVILNEQGMMDLLNQFSESDIEVIQVDHPLKLVLDDVINQTGVNLAWDLNVTGKGQTVCVIDSGIDYGHPDLSDNYVGGYDFVNNDNDPMDDYGHGTYVSGIIDGIAPDAKILAAKVFGSDGIGYESDILAGIDYCVQNKNAYNISVMLMSFGGWVFDTSCYCDSNLVANESNFAVSQGIFAVAASGNDGEAYLKAPACGSNVTSVGAVYKNDTVANFTNIEPLLDLLAPGVDVKSAKMGGGYETKSGTSASAAVAAGIASMILENETLAPLDLQYRLRSTGVIIQNNGTAYPRADAHAALLNNVTNTPLDQQGNQCEGTWSEYEPLALCCDDKCQGFLGEGCEAAVCTNGKCDATCSIDGHCSADGFYCDGQVREWRDYYCDTNCVSCSCDYTTGVSQDCAVTCYDSCTTSKCDVGIDPGICVPNTDCDPYTCSGGSCTGPCSQACGADCDGDGDCDYLNGCSGSCPGCEFDIYTCSSGCSCTNSYAYNLDDAEGYCTDCSDTTWNAGGSGDCTGESGCTTKCCGDDTGEKYRSCLKNSTVSWTCVTANDTCCNAATDCIDPGNNSCVTAASGWNMNGSQASDDYAYCNTTGGWQDCDQYYANCGAGLCGNASGVLCGEGAGCSGLGEYADSSTLACCGDDSGENYKTRVVDAGMHSWATNVSDRACCSAASDCTKSETCYANNTVNTDADGNGDNDFCMSGTWYDCNTSSECPAGYACSSNDCFLNITITLNAPSDLANISSYSVTFNATVSADPGLANVSLWGNWSGWKRNETNSSGTNNTHYIFTKDLTSYGNGVYIWGIEACTTGGCTFSANRTFRIDTTAPTPDPATIASVNSTSYSAMNVSATGASDTGVGGVQYIFNETTGSTGSTNSSWQVSNNYTDAGLSPNTSYCYITQYRDLLNNTGSWSTPQTCNHTLAETPSVSVTCGGTTGNFYCNVTPSIGSNPAGTTHYIDETTANTGGDDQTWNSTTTMYVDTGLAASTQYCYRIKGRNANGLETPYSSQVCDYATRLEITETVDPDIAEPTTTIYVYGHINLTNGTDAVNHPFSMWLNGSAMTTANLTAYGTYNSGRNATHTSSNDWDGGTFTNASYDSQNVTLNATEILPDANTTLILHLNNDSTIGENNTQFVDLSSNKDNGTCNSASGYCPTFASAGKVRGAFTFDGTNDYINMTKNATGAVDNFTIVAWVKPSALPQGLGMVVNIGDGVSGYGFGIGNGSAASGSNLTAQFNNVTTTVTYSTAGTYNWTAPEGVTSVDVEVWGGGASGAGSGDAGYQSAGGGGGGAYSKKLNITVVPSNNYTVVVGAGGVFTGLYNGINGNDSYFLNTSTVLAKGGVGGLGSYQGATGGAGGSSASGVGDIKYSGGNGGNGYYQEETGGPCGGGGGSSAGTGVNGNNGGDGSCCGDYCQGSAGSAPIGGGAGALGGQGNCGGSSATQVGGAGGGGGAAYSTYPPGGNGYQGKVAINYSIRHYDSRYTFPSANQWYHVVMTRRDGTTYFYVNGQQASGTTTATPIVPNNSMTIGAAFNGSYAPLKFFSGSIDEVAVYNRSLSAAEIAQLYESQRCGYYYCNGTFESEIVNAGSPVQWKNVSWTGHYNTSVILRLQVRSCDDAACSGESYVGPNGLTSGYFINGSTVYSLANISGNQYFQYKAYLSTNSSDGSNTPYLQELIVNYSAVVTDADGDFNYSFPAPATEGTYPVVVNTTFEGYYGNNSKDLLVSDYLVDGGSGTTCDSNNKCLFVKNATGSDKARFDNAGNVDVKGTYNPGQTSLTPPAKSFMVKNSTGDVLLFIDTSGNLYSRGTYYQQPSPSPSGNNDFIIKNVTGTVVGYIDGATGNMYFKGVLHYNSNF